MVALLMGIVVQVGCAGLTASPASSPPGSPSGGGATMSLNPPSITFPSVVVGNADTQAIIVTNTGTDTLTVTQDTLTGAQFSISGVTVPLNLSPGSKATVTVSFSPTSPGSASGNISILSNASSTPVSISLSGTGVAATHLLDANHTNLTFGNVNDGTSTTLSVTLTNSGNSNVTISGVTPSGEGFSASGVNAGTTLTPNQAATLNVRFAPTAPGGVSGSVNVASNATNSPASITMSGTGVQSSGAASVGLSWTPSTSSGVVGYNVYRGTSPGSYSRIMTLVAGNTYTDSSVQSGQDITYDYVVTAVNSGGVESTDSNPATATVP